MNFLSHFYFDRDSSDHELVLGTVLPDLIKNAHKSWNLHPEKQKALLNNDQVLLSILKGWNRHLEVDRHFHSSDFFTLHTRAIRSSITPFLENSPVKPFFLAHIALELLLDGLLIINRVTSADDFYAHLSSVNRNKLNDFLRLNGIQDTDIFYRFFDRFIHSEYLNRYTESHNIMQALNRICMRLWNDPLDEMQKSQLTSVLVDYQGVLKAGFMDIFEEINGKLKRGA